MGWEYRTVILNANAQEPETKSFLQSMWPSWEPPRHAPQALIPKLNDYGAGGWELIQCQPVFLDDDANILVQGGPRASMADNVVTGAIKARTKIPVSSPGDEPARYTHTYFCVFKRRTES